MLVNIDKSAMSVEQRGFPYKENLEGFVEAISNINPLLNFMCDTQCTMKQYDSRKEMPDGSTGGYDYHVHKVKVLQDGEELGALTITTRYRRNVGSELVYGVESFRITKERGRSDTTYSKDLKVALRTAKKSFIPRANSELHDHIMGNVTERVRVLLVTATQTVRYSIDINDTAMEYAEAAYLAHKEGKTTVEMPVKLKSVRDYDKYLEKCASLETSKALVIKFNAKQGYAIKVLEDGKVVVVDLDTQSVTKYGTVDDMPNDLANKFVMFKLLSENDTHAHLGVKFEGGFFFVVK